jgi:hypothetical protein
MAAVGSKVGGAGVAGFGAAELDCVVSPEKNRILEIKAAAPMKISALKIRVALSISTPFTWL